MQKGHVATFKISKYLFLKTKSAIVLQQIDGMFLYLFFKYRFILTLKHAKKWHVIHNWMHKQNLPIIVVHIL